MSDLPEFIRNLNVEESEIVAQALDEMQEQITDDLGRQVSAAHGPEIGEREQALLDTMSDEQQELLLKLDMDRARSERAAIRAAFWQGVQLGAGAMLWLHNKEIG